MFSPHTRNDHVPALFVVECGIIEPRY
ncbi:uncharacterized protein METZ01_LOCUS226158 [marine metagenome]|uniref:Uncharacterized protein n=1 Tax=marine metagenome TaxID=408172 RepID=A0A382GF29_9ZZZZ